MFGKEAFLRAFTTGVKVTSSSDAARTNKEAWSLSVARPLVRSIISIIVLSLPEPAK